MMCWNRNHFLVSFPRWEVLHIGEHDMPLLGSTFQLLAKFWQGLIFKLEQTFGSEVC